MKTLRDLSKEIQENPNKIDLLLTTFRTTSSEIRDFLFSMRQVPAYIVPALIDTFAIMHRESDPKTVRDLMTSDRYIGSLFVLVEDGSDWSYQGISTSGKPMGRPINSALIMELDPEKEITHVF
jgi:hypothetical protein